MELLSFKDLKTVELKIIKSFLSDVTIIDINDKIKEETISLRKLHGLKLPDAIIAATSKFLNLPIITADKQFAELKDIHVILYTP